jgi:hypothetical protein
VLPVCGAFFANGQFLLPVCNFIAVMSARFHELFHKIMLTVCFWRCAWVDF